MSPRIKTEFYRDAMLPVAQTPFPSDLTSRSHPLLCPHWLPQWSSASTGLFRPGLLIRVFPTWNPPITSPTLLGLLCYPLQDRSLSISVRLLWPLYSSLRGFSPFFLIFFLSSFKIIFRYCFPGWPPTGCVAQAIRELTALLTHLPKC